MTILGFSENGQTFRYELLSTKVAHVLQNLEENESPKQRENEILGRGASLVKKIIEGAILIEGTQVANLSPTQEGLFVYGYALSTIEVLSSMRKVEKFTDFFSDLCGQLEDIQHGKKLAVEKIKLLKEFFLALGNAFRGDIFKEKYTKINEEYRIPGKLTSNAL